MFHSLQGKIYTSAYEWSFDSAFKENLLHRSKTKKKKGGKKSDRGRNSSDPLESLSSIKPISRGNYGRRGISRRRTQNLGKYSIGQMFLEIYSRALSNVIVEV